tara:strand:- start:197 stop:484 length:288 start_codon:yes stop_codon:yes gene_type:complete
MSGKTEIKVYLPTRLVGQLDSRKQAGVRSKFIKEAIEEKLKRRSEASPFDFDLVHLLSTSRDKIHKLSGFQISMNQSVILTKLIQLVIDELRDGQ